MCVNNKVSYLAMLLLEQNPITHLKFEFFTAMAHGEQAEVSLPLAHGPLVGWHEQCVSLTTFS